MKTKLMELSMALAILVSLVLVSVYSSGCGASVDSLPIDDDTKIEIAIESGCAAAATAGCFEQDEIKNIVGDLKTSTQCVSTLRGLVDKAVTSDPVDIARLTAAVFTCKKFQRALSYLDGLVPGGIPK